ncbi:MULTISPECIES: iron chelate uptake ABC transporter family permease subunit [Arthrobacter]|uniref:Iron chelate uptake ABC transporter family permease subunit n=2 Tax=Arthrobacter TaxID=1663 RepID=A0ABU9KJA4_9MICC|nr:iron chelate uptake ABC transporter family permease subunit [Arthrobacter sp. YJM1]MDP5226776.1 iron chelate uptake ABC transporter family permease subunit [Arthrobacter sp. YJM1]
MRIRPLTLTLAALVPLLVFASVLLGSYVVTVPDLITIVSRHLNGERGIPGASFIVLDTKIPRAVLAAFAGAAFGLSGGTFQTLLRNPLASPDVIGVSSGASAGAVAAIVLFGARGITASLSALVGALLVALLIHSLSRGEGSAGLRLILAGIGVGAALQAVVQFLMSRTDIRTASDVLLWVSGSLNPASGDRITVLFVAMLALVPALALLARPLRVLELGDDAAAGLGVNVSRVRLGLLVVAVALAAFGTAAAGPLAFVAFLALPLARQLDPRAGLLAAALSGAVVVLVADFVGANVAPLLLGGSVLPVGIVTGALGAPFLLWLLVSPAGRTRRKVA